MWNHCFLAFPLALSLPCAQLALLSIPGMLVQRYCQLSGRAFLYQSKSTQSLSNTLIRYSDLGILSIGIFSDQSKLCHADNWGYLERDNNIQEVWKIQRQCINHINHLSSKNTNKDRYARKWKEAKIKDKEEKTKTVSPQKLPKPTKTQRVHNMRNLNTKLVRPLFSRK